MTRIERLCAALVALGLAAFVGLSALAAAAYPGGTYCAPEAAEYRFWGNFLCDLTQPVTGRGADNTRAALLARAAFVAVAVASAPFWWLLGGLAGGSAGRLVRLFGLVSTLATNLIAWAPSMRFPALHTASVFSAAIPALAAAALGSAVLHARARLVATLGAATLLFGAVNAIGYGHAVAVRAACVPWLPVVQKITALLAIAWMLAVALGGVRNSGRACFDGPRR
jgi:hypothetical protein